ncbi:MAG TPA: VWA domain-containing protein [Pyrinomonadaceae bacterium]|nr:VWA domain-containing protein [Pyrinomonadaceae bacterium]
MKKHRLLYTVLLAQLGASAFGQQPSTTAPTPPPQPSSQEIQKPGSDDVVRITTNLVQVDAVVTDKNGKIVTDLKPEEIKILEDGRVQKITNFAYYATETVPESARQQKAAAIDKNAPVAPPTRLRPEDVRRTIAIVVDDLGLSFESTHFVQRALKKFVDEQMQPGDLVAIIRTGGGMGALQQFTSDKRQLYAAIERVKWSSMGRGGVSAFAPLEPPTAGEAGPDIDARNEELNQFREDMFSVGTLGAISYVVKGLRELPGRKSILLVSDGFRIYSRDDPTRNYLALERLRRLIDEAGRASVVIYTMNATGLQTLSLTAADNPGSGDVEKMLSNRRTAAFETQEGLSYLARETGGIAIKNNNDLSGGIRRVLEDQKGYYLIGYRPDNSTFDPKTGRRTFHKLSLKITRPGKFNVRMRNGFYGVTDEDRHAPLQRTLAQQMVSALASPFGSTGVHLRLTSLFSNDPRAGSILRSMLHVDARDLTFTSEANGKHKCVFDVLAMTFGDNGVTVDQIGQTYTMQLTEAIYRRVLREGLVYYLSVPIKKPGAYQLRISFRDTSTERVGSASQFVEVPDLKKNRLALSGLVVRGENPVERTTAAAGANPSAVVAGNQAATNPDSATQDQDAADQRNPEASPAVRHFSRGLLMDYLFIIYNAHLDKTTNKAQLISQVRLFRDGKPVYTGKESPLDFSGVVDPKRVVSGGSIRLGSDLVPGDYVLQVIVKDMLADEKHRTVTQWMDFEIVK